MMLQIDNHTKLAISHDILESIAAQFTSAPIELLIVDDRKIQSFNREFRDIDRPTDVLSFPLDTTAGSSMPLGSIVISADHVASNAKIFGHSIKDELTLLFIHGLLHLLGYDHEHDNGEMRHIEREIIAQWELPKSLIVRTEER